jgi:hypothetical protein
MVTWLHHKHPGDEYTSWISGASLSHRPDFSLSSRNFFGSLPGMKQCFIIEPAVRVIDEIQWVCQINLSNWSA